MGTTVTRHARARASYRAWLEALNRLTDSLRQGMSVEDIDDEIVSHLGRTGGRPAGSVVRATHDNRDELRVWQCLPHTCVVYVVRDRRGLFGTSRRVLIVQYECALPSASS